MSGVSYGLEEKVVVVTGGSRGVGLELARNFLAQGARVVICGRKEENLKAAVEKLNGGDRLLSVAAHIVKAGVEMLTKVLASELAAFNIQVNSVAPGMVRTDFSKPFWSTPAIHDQIVKAIPAGRIAETADLVPIVLLLASLYTDYITGQTITVDGGASAI